MDGSEVFADSGLWIAAARQPDAQHQRAKELGKEIIQRHVKVTISDMVLSEVVTFVLKKDGHEPAGKLMDLLEANTTVLFVDRPVLEDAKALLRKYWSPRKRLSICDATSVVLMQRRGITDLYSFDSGFDGVDGVTRIG